MLMAMALALLASACGVHAGPGDEGDDYDCGLRPLESGPAGLRIGIQKARATLCAAEVEVGGRTYTVGDTSWLHEEAFELTEYAPITRANTTVAEPIAYELADVDPEQFLVMLDDPAAHRPGRFATLWGDIRHLPASVCQYANPGAAGYPADACPLQTGRTYSVQIDFRCGYERPIGPYGGAYWRVIDPPAAQPSGQPPPGLAYGADPGEIELHDADHMTFRSEMGGELQLERIDDPDLNPDPCEATWL